MKLIRLGIVPLVCLGGICTTIGCAGAGVSDINDSFAISVSPPPSTPRPVNFTVPPNPRPILDDPTPAPTPFFIPIPTPTPKPTVTPTTPLLGMTADQVRAVPQQVTIRGKVLTATAATWLNRMPMTNPPTDTTHAAFRLVAQDGSVIPTPLYIDRISVAKSQEVWASTAVTTQSSATELSSTIHFGPGWELGAPVDVVADFYDSRGQRYQLRSAPTVISAVY